MAEVLPRARTGMRLYIGALLDPAAPVAARRLGLLQLSLLALVPQAFHLLLAAWALPDLRGLSEGAVWGVGGFSLLLLGLILALRWRARGSKLALARRVFLDALWLGTAGLCALVLGRMGQEAAALGLGGLGLLGYGAGWLRLWFALGQAEPPGRGPWRRP
ncbi:MAG: hypothetical protein NZ849_11705 [Meiothermus sp.]|uniref:hypothetical protein n=1 Tax=Meiothermus sp. TaxID=1955249 RepID=UPI0025FB191E|nr:hypothetical protein [Meiothermus sp.]MCS7059071.1 hypothetical protein [Meiothermus sp.]MCS7195557.1 hypothetical protein [Meiothermus sp.]MCX7740706.1 hypothetical protein [Meiothermus sp.]MDW8090485.1 hypothetical protein [Meiothermus sp.]MDW8481014.1 hypothetical protein [Meiothermus sp.]